MGRLTAFAIFLAGILLAGCATQPPASQVQDPALAPLPPAVEVRDLKVIAGSWSGTLSGPTLGSPVGFTLTTQEDGSWEGYSSAVLGGRNRFEGNMSLRNGKIVSFSRTTGRTSTFTLHEGGGRRVLNGLTEDGSIVIRLTPAR